MSRTAIFKTGSDFGDYLDINLPEGCTTVIICKRTTKGFEPLQMLLRTQVYRTTILKYLEDNPEGVAIVPVLTAGIIEVKRGHVKRRSDD